MTDEELEAASRFWGFMVGISVAIIAILIGAVLSGCVSVQKYEREKDSMVNAHEAFGREFNDVNQRIEALESRDCKPCEALIWPFDLINQGTITLPSDLINQGTITLPSDPINQGTITLPYNEIDEGIYLEPMEKKP